MQMPQTIARTLFAASVRVVIIERWS